MIKLGGQMPNSGLITNGLGGNLVTHGLGLIQDVQVPVVTPVSSSGGGSVVVPQAIMRAEMLIKVEHIQTFKKTFAIITEHVNEIIKLPIIIKHVMLQMNIAVSELVLNTFTKGLSLDIREGGLELS